MSTADIPAIKTWHVRIDISEHGAVTHATAHLETGAGTDLTGSGEARRNPDDPGVPEIGDELATARALSHLAHILLGTAADDLSEVLHNRVRLDE